jgi:hypothetical protein
MYDTLEGLDYKQGECSYYVSQILSDMKRSTEKGDLINIPADQVRIGDVVVGAYSSHLVVSDDYVVRATVTPQNSRRDENGQILDPLVLVIPDSVLRRKQREQQEKF